MTPAAGPPGERSPQAEAERCERLARLPPGDDERFVGYGVMGLPFSTGHVLGLRRWPASSIGPAYTSVWHRSPEGVWQLFSDVAEIRSCSRYIGAMVSAVHVTPIRLTWDSPWRLRVSVASAGLQWEMGLEATPLTLAFGIARRLLSDAFAARDGTLTLLERIARTGLATGPIRLRGMMPNGQHYRIVPRNLWLVASSSASLAGADLGVPHPLPVPASLGDLRVPECGLFVFATARFT